MLVDDGRPRGLPFSRRNPLEGQTVAADIVLVGRSGARSGRVGSIGDAVFRALTFLFALLVLMILGGVIVLSLIHI